MKVGDLLTNRDKSLGGPMLIVLEIIKHPDNSAMDRVCLQWLPRNGGKSLRGELSRLITEKKYVVV